MNTIHLFIDTSTFLTFYAFTGDDLEELKKVSGLIAADKLKLYVPQQVVNEFVRNREGKLAKSLSDFKANGIARSIPRFMAEYSEVEAFRDAVKAFDKAKQALASQALKDALEVKLPADKAFADLIKAAGIIKPSEEIFLSANKRRIVGNPPGKKDSVGDQINWETLLSSVPEGADLHIVSKDGDFRSPLDSDCVSSFLSNEWKLVKNGSLSIHSELRPFLNAHFPTIHFAIDIQKRVAIESLIYTGSFQTTHKAVEALSEFVDILTWEEAKEIFDAGIANSQIGWIGTDGDVNIFYRSLMAKFADKIDFGMDLELEEKFPPPVVDQEDDEIPF